MLRQKLQEEQTGRTAEREGRRAADESGRGSAASPEQTPKAQTPERQRESASRPTAHESGREGRPACLPPERPESDSADSKVAEPQELGRVEILAERRAERRLTARLGQLLLDHHLISKKDLSKALEEQRSTGERLGHYLVRRGMIEEVDLLRLLSDQYGVPAAELDDLEPSSDVLQAVPAAMARRYRLVPVSRGDDSLDVAMVDPSDVVAISNLRFATGLRINPLVAAEDQLGRAIDQLYGTESLLASAPQSSPASRAPEARASGAPDAVAEEGESAFDRVKRMVIDRERSVVAAMKDPETTYKLAVEIDRFVNELLREARRGP